MLRCQYVILSLEKYNGALKSGPLVHYGDYERFLSYQEIIIELPTFWTHNTSL